MFCNIANEYPDIKVVSKMNKVMNENELFLSSKNLNLYHQQ